jgi:predicted dehydrogenase
MALTEDDCVRMIDAAGTSGVRLMVAYRLHFEVANLKALEIARAGVLGEIRLFQSVFCMQVKPGDIRLRQDTGGGTLYDIGVYCINAARQVFDAEPIEVQALSANSDDPRFAEVDETTCCLLRFPGERVATFVSSFGAADVSSYRIVGREAELRVEPAYDYEAKLAHHLSRRGRTRKQTFAKRDQFAPEIIYFSRCIRDGIEPEPSGVEGLADVRVIRALYRSAQTGRPVRLEPFPHEARPTMQQERYRPPVGRQRLVHTESPTES